MVGFTASNRSIYALHRESNCSWWTQMGSRIQKNAKIGDAFDHGSTANGRMAKRIPRLDSAHQLGLSTLCTGNLIVVGGHRWGAGIKKTQESGTILIMGQQLMVLWPNGDHSCIQRIE